MATIQAPSAPPAPSTRPCPSCASALTRPPCNDCGWEPGLVPVAQTQGPGGIHTTFVAERRHKFMLIFGLLACLVGIVALVSAFGSGTAGGIVSGIIFGPLIFVAGVLTLKNTRGGKAWWGLSAKEKTLAAPGLIAGGFAALFIIPVVLFAVMMMKMSTDVWRV